MWKRTQTSVVRTWCTEEINVSKKCEFLDAFKNFGSLFAIFNSVTIVCGEFAVLHRTRNLMLLEMVSSLIAIKPIGEKLLSLKALKLFIQTPFNFVWSCEWSGAIEASWVKAFNLLNSAFTGNAMPFTSDECKQAWNGSFCDLVDYFIC